MRAKTHFDSRGAAGRSLAARVSSFAGTKTNRRGARDAIARDGLKYAAQVL